MRKLFLSIIALTLGIGAWAQETQSVDYIDADGQQKTATATVVTDETETLSAGWYVVTGEVLRASITCNGDVHLILADGAKLTARGGEGQAAITVSGDGNSLTIYGQAAQSGQLIATGGKYAAGIGGGDEGSSFNITINGGTVTSTGGMYAAGIGGGNDGSGSNITINGGVVTANSGAAGAGIGGGNDGSGSNITINGGVVTANNEFGGAGIGGGLQGDGSNITINGGVVTANSEWEGAGIGGGNGGSGSNITINGGEVTASGGNNGAGIGAGIGGGDGGSGSNIRIAFELAVYADNQNPPTTEIPHAIGYDIAQYLNGRQYVIVKDVITGLKSDAIAAINAAISDTDNDNVKAIAANAETAINAATSIHEIDAIKTQAIAAIASAKAILGPLGEEHPGPAVKVTKGDTEVILYLPDKVEYIIRK